MKRAQPSRQGHLDALCGIYALTNYLRDVRYEGEFFFGDDGNGPAGRAREAFWHLVETAERQRMLTSDFLVRGYSAHHLISIFNEVADNLDLQLEAVKLSRLQRLGNENTYFTVADCVLNDGHAKGAVIVNINDHWLLSSQMVERCVVVVDSAGNDEAIATLTKKQLEEDVADGFAILPERSSILKCLHAETD